MGITYVKRTVRGPDGQERTLNMLVDSGTMYSLIPVDVWEAIGLKATRHEIFRLANGTAVERRMSDCVVRLPEGETSTPVVLGEPGDAALLGVVTLEELGLVLNPFSRTLHPMRMLLS